MWCLFDDTALNLQSSTFDEEFRVIPVTKFHVNGFTVESIKSSPRAVRSTEIGRQIDLRAINA